jgi:membrane protease YdiL (CAAX protease family)
MDRRPKGVLAYLLLAFGLAWVAWEIPARRGISPWNPLFQVFALPGAFAPAVAAIIVRRWVTHEGFADAGLRPDLRRGWRYYVAAWLLPIPVVAFIVAAALVLRLSNPDWTLVRFLSWLVGQAPTTPLPTFVWALIPLQVTLNALLGTPLLWGEEFGWRGYLQTHILPGRPLAAAIVTGLIWGMWHYPINLRGYNYPDHRMLGLVLFPIGTTLLSIIFGWLQSKTGSVWAPSLAHAATNAIGASLTLLLFMGGPNWIFLSYLGILAWIPLGAVCVWIIKRGYPDQRQSPPLPVSTRNTPPGA